MSLSRGNLLVNNQAGLGRPWVRGTGVAVVVAACIAISGCAAEDIEFQGKIFEFAGLTGQKNKKAPKMAPRSGLVVPPSTKQLPPPGSDTQQVGYDEMAAINDPDRASEISQEELMRRQKAYCDKHYEPARIRGDASADSMEGPAGPCRKSVFTALKKWNESE